VRSFAWHPYISNWRVGVLNFPNPFLLSLIERTSSLSVSLSREVLPKGRTQYRWPPCANYFILAPFYNENIIYVFYKTSQLPWWGGQLYWRPPLQLAFPAIFLVFVESQWDPTKLFFPTKWQNKLACFSLARQLEIYGCQARLRAMLRWFLCNKSLQNIRLFVVLHQIS